jgi:hypothetical protein
VVASYGHKGNGITDAELTVAGRQLTRGTKFHVDLVPEDMSDRIVSVTERGLTTTVDNIEHIESQSLYGIAVVRVFLQPTANIQQGTAQITAISQTQLISDSAEAIAWGNAAAAHPCR